MTSRSLSASTWKNERTLETISACCPVRHTWVCWPGRLRSSRMTGASLIASGRVPSTTRIFVPAVIVQVLPSNRIIDPSQRRPVVSRSRRSIPMGARAKVCMVTYGDAAASLPPLLHEGMSLAAAGFEVQSLHGAAAAAGIDTHADGFTSRRFVVRIRALARALLGSAAEARAVSSIQQLLSYAEFSLKAS